VGPALRPGLDLCLLCGSNGGASAALNIALYLPLGAALRWRTGRLGRAIGWGALVSLAVEVAQLAIPGRHTALSDLVANTIGTASGAALAIAPRAWLLPRGFFARLATALVLAACAAMLVLPGALFRPTAPGGAYYGQWTPSSPYDPTFVGTVLDVRLGDTPLPSRRIDGPARIRGMIERREPFTVRFVAGPPSGALTPLFRLVAGPFNAGLEALQVGVDGQALVLTPRLAADDARLSRPEVQLEDGLAYVSPGDTVTVSLRARHDRGFDVTVDGASRTVGFTVGTGWSLLYATSLRSATALAAIGAAWLMAMGFAAAWYATGGRTLVMSGGALLALAATTPAWSELLPTPPREHAALVAGLAAGAALRRVAEREVRRRDQRREGAQTS
jgi:hypothetical protein